MRPTNRTLALMALLGAAGLATGCNTEAEAKPTAGMPRVGELMPVSKEVRAQIVKDMQDDLAAINAAVQALADKAEAAKAETKAEAKAKLTALRDKAAALNGELEKAKDAEEAAWDKLKAGFKRSHQELKESVDQARSWLGEKIAP